MPNQQVTFFSRFWNLLKSDRQEIRNIYLFSILSGLLSLGLPLGIQVIINFIELGQLSTSWFVLVFLVVLSIGFSGLLNIFQLRITENLQQRIFTRSAFEFAGRIPKFKWTKEFQHFSYELTHRFFDTLTIQKGLSKLLIDFTAAILQLVFCLVLLSFYHSFFIFLGLFLVFVLLIIIRFTGKHGMYTSLEESSYKYKIAHWLKEVSRARFSFSMAGMHSFHLVKTDQYVHGYLNARDQHFKVLVKQYTYLIFFKVLIALSFLIIGGILVIQQQMNIGQFVASEIIILLILSAVEKLILSIEVVYDVLTAVEKIGQVTDLEIEEEGTHSLTLEDTSQIELSFHDVGLQLSQQTVLLDQFDFELKPCEKVCIVSDSSLTTDAIFSLITAQKQPDGGNVTCNGIPLQNLNPSVLREQIGTLLSKDKLIQSSLLENILFGRDHVSTTALDQWMNQLGLKSYLFQLDNTYESILYPEQGTIPRDVERKLLLCRALIGNPSILLIDEPTAGLTSDQRQLILDTIFAQTQKSILIASTDSTVMERCDRIIECSAGKIIFDGNYQSFQLK
ncbi:MAG: ATP-binding cassette domain-containing protein [Flavobacteriales bacterium]